MGQPGDKVGRAEAALELGSERREHNGKGDTEAVEEILQRGLDLGSAEAARRLGILLRDRGKSEAAQKVFQRGAILEYKESRWRGEHSVKVLLELASFFVGRGVEEKARAAYEAGRKRAAEGEVQYVNFLVSRTDVETAKRLAAKHSWWRSPDAAIRLVRLLVKDQCLDAAKTILSRLGPDDSADSAVALARLAEAVHDHSQAMWRYEHAMRKGSAQAAQLLGALREKLGDSAGAQRAFRQAHILNEKIEAETPDSVGDASVPTPRN
jgi:tetratricopeptide (TPR) repeat protein